MYFLETRCKSCWWFWMFCILWKVCPSWPCLVTFLSNSVFPHFWIISTKYMLCRVLWLDMVPFEYLLCGTCPWWWSLYIVRTDWKFQYGLWVYTQWVLGKFTKLALLFPISSIIDMVYDRVLLVDWITPSDSYHFTTGSSFKRREPDLIVAVWCHSNSLFILYCSVWREWIFVVFGLSADLS